MARFRFSSNIFGLRSRDEFTRMCRRAEEYGYDTIFAVLNVPFWNPALLAREIATADILTGGRLEVGLGSGHMKWEFDEAGIGWEPHNVRAELLMAAIGELTRLFAGDGYRQQAELRQRLGFPPLLPVQRRGFGGYGPPLLVGGSGDRILRIAAETADIVGIGGLWQVKGQPPGVFRLCTAAEADERVRFARDRAGERAGSLEWHALIQVVRVTGDRRAAAAELAEQYRGTVTAQEILVNPFLFIGTVEEIAGQIIRNRDRNGFTYYTVHEPYLDAFAPVMERVRALEA